MNERLIAAARAACENLEPMGLDAAERLEELRAAADALAAQPAAEPANIETRTYADGTTATGPAPLPAQSPNQQTALQCLDDIENLLGGPNGPTVRLREIAAHWDRGVGIVAALYLRAEKDDAEIKRLRAELAAQPARAGGDAPDWRELAARVMDALAENQEQINAECPEHVKCYPSWQHQARWLRWHAEMFRTGKPYGSGAGVPAVLAALAAAPQPAAAEHVAMDLSGLQRYRMSKQWHSMNRDAEGPYVLWDDVVALAAAAAPLEAAAKVLGQDEAAAVDFYARNPSAALTDLSRRISPAQPAAAEPNFPDAIRVPIDSLHADAMYLASRVAQGTMSAEKLSHVIRERLDAAKSAIAAATFEQPAASTDEEIEALAVARYKVVPAHSSMFWSHAVVAGDGQQQLYVGREVECQNMARKFAGAFLDGAFVAQQPAASTVPATDIGARICRAVAELPDRNSPEDWPEAMLVTHDELQAIVAAEMQDAAPAVVERKPLTDAQIEKGREATFSTNNPFCPCDSKTMRKAVRWAERAHRIGSSKEGGDGA